MTTSLPDADNSAAPCKPVRRVGFWSALFDSEASLQRSPARATHPLQPGLPDIELAGMIRQRFYEDREWARARRRVWSARATVTRLGFFLFSALATIFLGIASLDGFAIVGFIFSALVTTVSGVETFFNWRSRWVAADMALARWHDLEENLAYYVANTAPAKLDRAQLGKYDQQRRGVWAELSRTWVSERQSGSSID